jgi:branched-chain amino acid transport system substrate-binding protein
LNKKLLLIPLALLLVISLIAIGCPSPTPTQTPPAKDKIVIGQSLSFSGYHAITVATIELPNYDMWAVEVNAAGGLYIKEYDKKIPVEIIRYDDTSDPSTGAKLMEKLILEDKVDFALSPQGNDMVFAAAPIANKYEYILIIT